MPDIYRKAYIIISTFALLCGLVFFLVCPSFSQSQFSGMNNPTQFKKKLNEATKKINTLECDFVQEKNLSVVAEQVISKGKFYFKKENQLRWEYTDPFSYIIIIRNNEIYVKDESKESHFDAQSNKIFGEINHIIVGSIRGTILNDEKNFRVNFLEGNDLNMVRLYPKTPGLKNFFSEISIYFDRLDYTVTRFEILESSGDNTRIVFSNKKQNLPVPDEKFHIK
jgi:outer membrane lipoprotein-sorting protein